MPRPLSLRLLGVFVIVIVARGASAEVIGITGSSSATVIQFDGILPIQSDFSQVIIPLTQLEPPAVSIAQVDRYGEDKLSASGAVLAMFTEPDLTSGVFPNDVGMDLAAFAEDDTTSWFMRGEASETRTIVVKAADAGVDGFMFGATNRGQSRVLLSGVMFLTAREAHRDLTGAEVKLTVLVERREFNRRPTELIRGEVVLAGGPNGAVAIARADGSFSGTVLPVVDFTNAVEELPLVQAVLFAGTELPFEYEFDVGLPFELVLTVTSEARTIPGGVGASAVFGLPQANLPAVMQKIAKDDLGTRLATAISDRVDTTGASYQGGGPGLLFPGLCGAGAVELGATLCLCLGMIGARRRARQTRRATSGRH